MPARKLKASLLRKASLIQLAAFDIDGVLTDGRLFVGPGGAEFKAVHIHDGHGLKKLAASGIAVAVISGRRSEAMEYRLADLGVKHVFLGVPDKLAIFLQLLSELGLQPHQASFMGDDEPDLMPMQQAGLALTVREAVPEVRAAADWVSTLGAGQGAVREACELLLSARAARPGAP